MLLWVYESDHGQRPFSEARHILNWQTSILFNGNSVQHYVNIYFNEASMVQAAEIKIDFLFFSFLVVVLVKEVPGTVLRAYRHFSWYVCNTWLLTQYISNYWWEVLYWGGQHYCLNSADRDREPQTQSQFLLRSLNMLIRGERLEVWFSFFFFFPKQFLTFKKRKMFSPVYEIVLFGIFSCQITDLKACYLILQCRQSLRTNSIPSDFLFSFLLIQYYIK